jgi:ubiquinone/menaquinone biosynthesis C-methylase UbiE
MSDDIIHTLSGDAGKRDSYDRESAIYDQTRYGTRKGKWYRELEACSLAHFRGLPDGALVIDLAAGTGRFTEDLVGYPWKVFAADQSRGMLEKLRLRLPDSRVTISVANSRQLPFKSESFDAATSFKFLHLFPHQDVKEMVREMTRILKPNGLLMVEVNNALYGVMWGFVRDVLDCWVLRKKKTFRTVVWPHRLRDLFSGLRIRTMQGVWFPGSGTVASFSPSLARVLEKLGKVFPFCYLTGYLIIVAQKPTEKSRSV